MSIKYIYGDLKFGSKKAARAYFTDYLKNHDSIEPELLPSFKVFVSNHPIGINWGETELIIDYNGKDKNLTIINNDGKKHLSLKTILDGKNIKPNLIDKLRKAIAPQIEDYRHNNKPPHICPMCHNFMDHPEVDHIKTFKDLYVEFLNSKSLSIETMKYNEMTADLLNEWCEYHEHNATLRYLCRKCNVSRNKNK